MKGKLVALFSDVSRAAKRTVRDRDLSRSSAIIRDLIFLIKLTDRHVRCAFSLMDVAEKPLM